MSPALDGLQRLGLTVCPVCVSGALVVDEDAPSITCAGGCMPQNVRDAVYRCGMRLTGTGLVDQKEAVLQLVAAAAQRERIIEETGTEGGGPAPEREPGEDDDAPAPLDDGQPQSDLGNAKRFVLRHGANVRHVPGLGWLIWDGRHWSIDQAAVVRLAKETVTAMYQRAVDGLRDQADGAMTWFRHARASQAAGRIKAMLDLAETEIEVSADVGDLDGNPMLLNTASGIVDLPTGEVENHRRELMMTKIVDVPVDTKAEAPRFMQFLADTFEGDAERIGLLKRFAGYTLTGLTVEQKVFIFAGPGGNGKSVLVQILREVLGSYALQVDFEETLAHTERQAGSARPDLMRLRGARAVFSTEIGEGGHRLDERRLKELTGGEAVVARELYQSPVEFTPRAKFIIGTNHLPEVRGADDGIWRRLQVLPFNVKVSEEKKDRYLADKIIATESPGVLAWALEGCREYLTAGLGTAAAVEAATSTFKMESDVVGLWLQASCLTDIDPKTSVFKTPRREVYSHYSFWCKAEGEKPLSAGKFARELRRRGAVVDGGHMRFDGCKTPVNAWRGIRLKTLVADEFYSAAEN